jgi:L-glyceraldehyde 3-phosphate reductase
MKYKRCGHSGLKLPAVSLGLWHNFGGPDSFTNQKRLIFRSFDLGITHFDLANNYGPPPGAAEINFGKILAAELHSYRDELVISTKAGYGMWAGPYGDWGSRKYLISSLDQSLKRMNLEYVDIFYSHRPDPGTPLEETMSTLAHIVRQGKALYVGISNYGSEGTLEASRILRSIGTPCLIHQPRYNMFERTIEGTLLPVLRDEGIGCIAFSPLAQGLLSDKYLNGIPRGSRASKSWSFLKKSRITPEIVAKIAKLNNIAQHKGQTLAQMAVSWILRLEEITSVLVGASTVRQIEENVHAVSVGKFSDSELSEIDGILKN